MKSDAFYDAVAKAYDIPFLPLRNGSYRGPASDWLYHPTQGPWADASARFTELTKGEVRAVVSGAAPDRVFGALELPRVIANSQVSTIEDLPRQTLSKVVAERGLQPAFKMVVAKSHENVGTLRIEVDASGVPIRENGSLILDSRAYTVGTSVPGKTPTSTGVTRNLADLMGPPNPTARAGQAHLQTWQAQIALDSGVQPLRPAAGLPGATIARGAVVVGTAAAVGIDALATGREAAHLLDQDNLTGAQSRIVHFGARNVGIAGGGAMGASAGAVLGGVPGMVVGGAVGGVAGAVGGEKIADAIDRASIYSQRGSDGNIWHFDDKQPQQGWARMPRPGEFGPQGPPEDVGYNSQSRLLHAGPRLADELNYRASNTAVELELAHVQALKAPFTQPAGPQDAPTVDATPWTRDPASHQWSRYVADPIQAAMGIPTGNTEQANPQRSFQLDQAAKATIAENLTHSRPAIAQRYQDAYDQSGWSRHGPAPAAVTNSGHVPPSQQRASDGREYTQASDGQWTAPGALHGTNTAQGNVREELNATRHQVQAPMPTRAPFEQAQLRRFEAEPALQAESLQMREQQGAPRPTPPGGDDGRQAAQTPQAAPSVAQSAPVAPARPSDPRDSNHPDHRDFQKIYTTVAQDGRWDARQSTNIAARVLADFKADPLGRRVDVVAIEPDLKGQLKIITGFAPWGVHKGLMGTTTVDPAQAARVPAEQAFERLAQNSHQQAAQDQQRALAHGNDQGRGR